jgi:hypothetical protein
MLGVPAGSSLTYAHNAAGSKAAFESLSRHTRVLRAKMASKFTDEDREEQKRSGLKS